MIQPSARQRWTCYAAAAVVYFIAAYWLKVSYVPAAPQAVLRLAGERIRLLPPFEDFLGSRFAVIAADRVFGGVADSIDNEQRSTIIIYEDDRRLGPAHTVHAEVADIGHGRFSHYRYKQSIILFSSSDNSDPRTNGRAYWAIRPEVEEARPQP